MGEIKLDITASMVKQLRDRTGAGLMDCKKALVECDGDLDNSVDLLRKKGADMAAARSGRAASEGLIVCKLSDSRDSGAMVEINCETDFVSRGDVFRAFATPLAEIALGIGEDCDDVNVLNAMPFGDSGQTVEEARHDLVSRIRENIQVNSVVVMKAAEGAVIGSYIHRERIGAMVELSSGAGKETADDLAIHIAVKKPKWLDADSIPSDIIEKERQIYLDQARDTGKPEHILDRIVDGRIKKFTSENTFVNQPYYEDEDKTVSAHLGVSGSSANRFALTLLGQSE